MELLELLVRAGVAVCVLRVEEPEVRLADVLVDLVDVDTLVERPLLVERVVVALVEREGCAVLVLRVLVPLVERVAVAVVAVERVDVGVLVDRVVVAVPAEREGVAVAERVEVPAVRVASERVATVFELLNVRPLLRRSLPAALRLTDAPRLEALRSTAVPRTLVVLRISRALTIPTLRLEKERSGCATA